MDELDKQIVLLLKRNGRKKFLEISKALGVSESTVRNRVKLLEKAGVVREYTALVDARKLGFEAVAIIGLNAEPLKFLKVVETLSKIPDIEYLATGTGEYMILLEVWKKNQEELNKFISEKISVVDGVTKISPTIIVEKIRIPVGEVK